MPKDLTRKNLYRSPCEFEACKSSILAAHLPDKISRRVVDTFVRFETSNGTFTPRRTVEDGSCVVIVRCLEEHRKDFRLGFGVLVCLGVLVSV